MARAGDDPESPTPAAIDSLLERYLPALRAFVRLRVGGKFGQQESSSDLVQSVCREILTARERFQDQGEAAFKGWLFTTALRKIIDKRRYWSADKRDLARRAEPGAGADDDAPSLLDHYATLATPSREVSLQEQVRRVESAMEKLGEEQREVVTLHKIVGLSHAEIARQLGKSEENCRQILRRALVRLAAELDEG